MKPKTLVMAFFIIFVSLSACSRDSVVTQTSSSESVALNTEAAAREVIALTGWPIDTQAAAAVSREPDAVKSGYPILINRQALSGDIVHYSFVVPVGPGPYDVIGLHRVVKEDRPYCPIRTTETVFMLHGTPGAFETMFLFGSVAASLPDDYSVAFFLADNDVDVWGIDQSWALVPQGTTDFSFMADWDFQHDIDNLRVGLAIARFTRALTGNGIGKMNLLGFSTGCGLGYAYVNEESQLSPRKRHVGGFIPIDLFIKTDLAHSHAFTCGLAAQALASIEAGVYQEEAGTFPRFLTELARNDPDGPSPVFPGFTNMQAVIFAGSAPLGTWTPWWHAVAGTFDANGVPLGLVHVTQDAWLDFFGNLAPYGSMRFAYDLGALSCDEVDLPYDDHLGDITIPIMYVGGAGGTGVVGEYMLTLIGSTDISSLVVRERQIGEELLDYGHIDLLIADNAQDLVWSEVLDWIESHPSDWGRGDDWAKD
jgi:hypothetical protein